VNLLKNRYFLFYLSLISLLFYSCRTVFPAPDFVNFTKEANQEKIFIKFSKEWPHQLSMDQSALIGIGRKKIAAIGLCALNSDKDKISLALMTLTGMKLLEMKREDGKTDTYFSIPEIKDRKSASKQLIQDIKTIYFPPVRNPDNCEIRKNKIIYQWQTLNEKMLMVFGKTAKDQEITLREKKQYHDNNLISIVYYSDYKRNNGKNIPMTIHYQNIEFNYSLILKTKKLYNYDEK
jgi:hypothetical protein